MTSYIICAFISGFLLATVIFWIVNRKQRQDWQEEYRRLMSGISTARNDVVNLSVHRAVIAQNLDTIYRGE